ncbi:polymorphic toxin-type HINT domain-containing protein [Actinomadura meridiana]|uniref:polymorphic toxin-type HINT domain-containing protein n=1 Tax=Actinomadura meridiana TaxID=559626 RepID=UPI0031E9D6E6
MAAAMSCVLAAALLAGCQPPGSSGSGRPEAVSAERPVKVHKAKVRPRDAKPQARRSKRSHHGTPKATWPKAGTASVTPTSQDTKGLADEPHAVKAGSAPVTLRTTTAAKVRVLDHAAAARVGLDGVLLTVSGPAVSGAGRHVDVSLGYGAFAEAAGAGYGSRLRLVQLPECALSTPDRPECRVATPLAGGNNAETKTVTAKAVTAGTANGSTVVLAAAPSESGGTGDYKAAPLAAASSWSTSVNSGSFSWNYDMAVPAVPGGLVPQVGLSYSSGTVDGRTSNGNNQASWAGDGFDLDPGFVERSYKSCGDDGVKVNGIDSGDLCWGYDNATISFQGHSGQLVPVSADEWRIRGDDGTKIVRVRDTSRGNGDNDGEYFVATTSNGTRYYFGYNRLPNWGSGDKQTNSVETVPVFGDDSDEPCHGTAFDSSWCQQGRRWNLDLVIDPNGNDITYWYNPETNNYGRAVDAAKATPYTRGATLDHIEYGQRVSDIYSSTVKPMARVNFGTGARCLEPTASLCDPAKIDANRQYWYDTPWDMNCKSGADCTNLYSPTFWTRTRLAKVTTQTLQPDGSYKDIDSWALHHRWGDADNDYQLLLDSIQHTATASTKEVALPPTTLKYTVLQNRLDKTGDGLAPFLKKRLSTVDDESGGQIDVNYSAFACDWGKLPTPQSNTTHCFPQMYQPSNDVPVTTQWFSKYVVQSVIATDRTGGAPDMVTRYSYLDGGAWAFDDDDGLTKEKLKTWSQWRGHGHVRVETGGVSGMSTQTDHYFLRGMDGDRDDPSDPSRTRTVTVPDGEGGTITDDQAWAGHEYRTESYDKPGGKVLTKSVSTPWKKQTAKLTRSWGTITANLTGTASARSFTSLDEGAGSRWREVATNTVHDDRGRPTRVEELGDTGVSSDDKCTRTTYADNTTKWIFTGAIRTETVAGKCSASPDLDTRPDGTSAVISDIRVRYDGQAYGQAPTRGLATLTETLKSRHGNSATYLDDAATYDTYGRPVSTTTGVSTSVFDPSDDKAAPKTTVGTGDDAPRTTTTDYSPSTGRPAKVVITTPPATAGEPASAQAVTTYFEPQRGLPVVTTDANGRRTDVAYDALGRVTDVWKPDRSRASGQSPNLAFVYHDSDDAIRSVETRTLTNTGSHDTSYTLYDGFGRVRQTQAPGPDDGRILTDAFYDERGQAALTYAPYYATSAPSGVLSKVEDATGVESQTVQTFDGLGRVTQARQASGDGAAIHSLSTTTTSYGGDSVTVTPPQGATPTTTFTDAAGHLTGLRQYHADAPTGPYDSTAYGYDPSGHLTKLTGPDGSVWTWTYDQLGHQIKATDPDTGTTTKTYDDRGELTSSTDGRGKTITHTYDNLSRELQTRAGTALTSQTWDPAGNKGQVAATTRYTTIGGATYPVTATVNAYDALYRPTKTTLTVPSIPGQTSASGSGTGLAGDYTSTTAYNLDGTVRSVGYPAAGGLPAEVVAYTYNSLHQVTKVSGLSDYLTNQTYDLLGKPLQSTLNAGGHTTWITNGYEFGTQRLHSSRTDQEDVTGPARAAVYGYQTAGNVTSITDASRTGTDTQCFQYDHLARLTEAFTPRTATCPSTPDGSTLGGPAPYWTSYTYNTSGTRKTETQHDPSGTTPGTTRTYNYPTTASAPHTLTDLATTTAGTTTHQTYDYDAAGNTTTRRLLPDAHTTDSQSLTWTDDNLLAKAADTITTTGPTSTVTTTRTSDYLQDPTGGRLAEHVLDSSDPAKENTTLYLGNTELNLVRNAAAPTATRYYSLGAATAIRTDDDHVTFQINDPHGTATTGIDAATGALDQRYQTPFGDDRGTAPAHWAGTRGFVGGTKDTGTGLTLLGARDYDPSTGRFISPDPILAPDDPQSLATYTYAGNNPVTLSDPSGQRPKECSTGEATCTPDNHHINDQQATADHECSTGRASCPDSTPPHGSTPGQTALPDSIEIYPTIFVPRNWAKRMQFSTAFLKRIAEDCKYSDFYCDSPYEYLGGPGDYPYSESALAHINQILTTDVFLACSDVGGCPDSMHGHWYDAALANASDPYTTTFDAPGKTTGSGRASRKAKGREPVREAPTACSFTPSTKVLMPDGKTKPIGKIKPGDKVEAADPRTGKHKGPRTVDATIVNHDTDLADLTVQTADNKTATLHTTANHPFWNNTTHTWTATGDLRYGHRLNTTDGDHPRVLAVRIHHDTADMYNLTVRQLHTYYVLAGTTPVLVHNHGEACPTGGSEHDPVDDAIRNSELDPGVASPWDYPTRAGHDPVDLSTQWGLIRRSPAPWSARKPGTNTDVALTRGQKAKKVTHLILDILSKFGALG